MIFVLSVIETNYCCCAIFIYSLLTSSVLPIYVISCQ